jgi:ADP-ribose pyrophosphatase YjhB (NUDIX family)
MAEPPWQQFRYCPRCGAPRAASGESPAPFRCEACEFLYFFNPATAVAALVVRDDGMALFIRRAKDPARGKLALVGGFVDVGESAEGALRREIREEVRLEIDDLRFLSSTPNQYRYAGTVYPVVDLMFSARAAGAPTAEALDGVESVHWLDPRAVDLEELAFPSMREALARYRAEPRR